MDEPLTFKPATTEAIVYALVKRFADVKPQLAKRVHDAGKMVLHGGVTPTAAPHVYRVASRSNPGHTYTVTMQGCPCFDTSAPLGLCAHRLAVRLYEKVVAIEDAAQVLLDQMQTALADLRLAQAQVGVVMKDMQAMMAEHALYAEHDPHMEVRSGERHTDGTELAADSGVDKYAKGCDTHGTV